MLQFRLALLRDGPNPLQLRHILVRQLAVHFPLGTIPPHGDGELAATSGQRQPVPPPARRRPDIGGLQQHAERAVAVRGRERRAVRKRHVVAVADAVPVQRVGDEVLLAVVRRQAPEARGQQRGLVREPQQDRLGRADLQVALERRVDGLRRRERQVAAARDVVARGVLRAEGALALGEVERPVLAEVGFVGVEGRAALGVGVVGGG